MQEFRDMADIGANTISINSSLLLQQINIVETLKERASFSRQTILKYILVNCKVGEDVKICSQASNIRLTFNNPKLGIG